MINCYDRLGSRTSRVKTTGTPIDKLQREDIIKLSRINDLAGARIVLSDGGMLEQEEAVDRICEMFDDEVRPAHRIDRRSDPRQGYRAMHVVVFPNGTPVEIQVRTKLQDTWAQIFERLADQWGRELRYGGGVAVAATESNPVRVHLAPIIDQIVGLLKKLSQGIAMTEESRRRRALQERSLINLRRALSGIPTGVPVRLRLGPPRCVAHVRSE
jgi:ppGpp synthetase/RelA/SpoT-type nucleotidyltranferase